MDRAINCSLTASRAPAAPSRDVFKVISNIYLGITLLTLTTLGVSVAGLGVWNLTASSPSESTLRSWVLVGIGMVVVLEIWVVVAIAASPDIAKDKS